MTVGVYIYNTDIVRSADKKAPRFVYIHITLCH